MADIGEAVHAMRHGARVAREGWNGNGMFIYYVAPNAYPATSPVAKRCWADKLVPYQAYIAMFTAQGTVVPWLCSQSDLLANDWVIE